MDKSIIIAVTLAIILNFPISVHAGEWSSLLKEIKKDLQGKEDIQLQGIGKLEEQDHVKALAFLIQIMRNKKTPFAVMQKASEVISGYKSKEVKKYLLKYVKGKPYSSIYLFDAFCKMAIDGSKPVIVRVAANKSKAHVPFRILALKALAKFQELDDKTIDILVEALEPGNNHGCRKAAAETLGTLTDKKTSEKAGEKAVAALNKYLSDRVIGQSCLRSICKIQGMEFVDDSAKDQGKGGQQQGGGQAAGEQKQGGALGGREIDGEPGEENQAGKGEASFYGIEIKGHNILFVLDRSGSMDGPKLEKLKGELINMLDHLGGDVSVCLLFFGGGDHLVYRGRNIKKLNDKTRKSMKKFINKVKAGGGTPVASAMTYSYKKIVRKNNIDTIYLLSDGQPNTSPDTVREIISKLNHHHSINIHTISIGSDSEFLKNVADDNNGDYHVVK